MSENIESHLFENRVFLPSAEFSENARVSSLSDYQAKWQKSVKDPEAFWSEEASELQWQKPWAETLQWEQPFARWFAGGELNVAENCVDRHVTGPLRNKAAIIFQGEPGDKRVITYQQLYRDVCRFANVLKRNEVKQGDRVLIYMGMIPEAVVAMLACARIGAVHSVVFAGFSGRALRERIDDAGVVAVITADGSYRRSAVVPLKQNVDLALKGEHTVKRVIVFRRVHNDIHIEEGRDVLWHRELEYVNADCPAVSLDSEHPLFILYTSGSTGKPKGILHTTAGYLTQVYSTTKYVFDIRPEDVFWCTADIGWITGHSCVVYGPLCNGATMLMYEGAPDWPERDRIWGIVEEFGVTILFTAPTAVRACVKWGDEWPAMHDLSSLRLLGTAGEPINPEAWVWFHDVIGGGRCPIVDTWWQTETGAPMITPLPGATPTKPGSATFPFFGIDAAVVDDEGNEVPPNVGGKLVIRHPWPSMLRTIYGDTNRYEQIYWDPVANVYVTGDGARRDKDGYFWIIGRTDDVLNVAGHRLGTAEIESALGSHDAIAEAAAVGRPDAIKGQSLVVFVTVKTGIEPDEKLRVDLRKHVAKVIGAIARPDEIRFTEALPKTRSGKIMRRLLRDIAQGNQVTGDVTALEDLSILAKLSPEES